MGYLSKRHKIQTGKHPWRLDGIFFPCIPLTAWHMYIIFKIHWNNFKCITCTAARYSFVKQLQDVFFTIRCLLHKLKSVCVITRDRRWEFTGHNKPMRIKITIATLHFDLLLFCWISQPGSQSCGYYGRLKQKFTFLGQGRQAADKTKCCCLQSFIYLGVIYFKYHLL